MLVILAVRYRMTQGLPLTALSKVIYLESRLLFFLLSHVHSIFVTYNSHLHNDLSFSFSLHRHIFGLLLDNSSFIWFIVLLWQRGGSLSSSFLSPGQYQLVHWSRSIRYCTAKLPFFCLLPFISSFRGVLIYI